MISSRRLSLQWRHNGRDGVSYHQPLDCLLNGLFRRRSQKSSKLRVTGLCAANSPVTGEFPAQRVSNAEMFPFDDGIMLSYYIPLLTICNLTDFPPRSMVRIRWKRRNIIRVTSDERHGFSNQWQLDCLFNSLPRPLSTKYQRSASLALSLREIYRWSLKLPRKEPVINGINWNTISSEKAKGDVKPNISSFGLCHMSHVYNPLNF